MKASSKGKLTVQLKILREEKESLTTPTFSTKRRIKLLNLKRRFKILKKN